MLSTKIKTVRVVIVEDYKLTRIGLRSSLNEFDGINVIGETEDAEKGIKMVQELNPDVVLMDLGLPGMNGIEATQQIKAGNKDIKI
ncbi:MAG: response regulator transcription factor [Candidatus Gastranaerophilales bacterium]|nr:response regulator transcription factor [Candidatus Gastranaerophilales bacterium]